MPLPSMRRAVRAFLLTQPVFSNLITPDRVVYKAPPDVTSKYVRIQIPGNISLSGDDVAWSPLVQVDGLCPANIEDADDIVWDLVAAAATAFGQARSVIYQNTVWRGRLIDGPLAAPPDISRGESSPLARALMRVELKVHNR